MSTPSGLSPNVVIMTRQELDERENAAFQRGVKRGRYEAAADRSTERVARNCINWSGGRCESCGVQWQHHEVDADFKCPHFARRA